MKYIGINHVIVNDIWRSPEKTFRKFIKKYSFFYSDKDIIELHSSVQNKETLNIEKTVNFCRLCLREDIWANIFSPV